VKPIIYIIVGITIVLLVAVVIYFGLGAGERARSEEDWHLTTINATWGTSIEVEYADGNTELLNVRPLLEVDIKFKDKKVLSFKYILSSKGISEEYDSIEIDMLDFEVIIYVGDDNETQWEQEETYGNRVTVDMDGEWRDVYCVQVDADDLEMLDVGSGYNLSFTPSGTINYRVSAASDWISVPLPSWFYIHFNVMEETTDDNGDGDKWIEVELGEEAG